MLQYLFNYRIYNVDASGAKNTRMHKFLNLETKTKFYQAGTSEMFGKVVEIPQSEKTFLSKKPICSFKSFCTLDNEKL